MKTVKIDVSDRSTFGKEKIKKIRAKGLLPIEVYTKGQDNISLVADYKEVSHHLLTGNGRNTIFSFNHKGLDFQGIPYEIQVHPISKHIMHLDLKAVSENEKVRARLAIKSKGISIGVKKGGKLQQKIDTVWLSVLPSEIPAFIEVDITNLEAGQQIQVKDLNLPASAEVLKFSPTQKVFFVKG